MGGGGGREGLVAQRQEPHESALPRRCERWTHCPSGVRGSYSNRIHGKGGVFLAGACTRQQRPSKGLGGQRDRGMRPRDVYPVPAVRPPPPPTCLDQLDGGHLRGVPAAQVVQQFDPGVAALAVGVPHGGLLEDGLYQLRIVHESQRLRHGVCVCGCVVGWGECWGVDEGKQGVDSERAGERAAAPRAWMGPIAAQHGMRGGPVDPPSPSMTWFPPPPISTCLSSGVQAAVLGQGDDVIHVPAYRLCPRARGLDPAVPQHLRHQATDQGPALVGGQAQLGLFVAVAHAVHGGAVAGPRELGAWGGGEWRAWGEAVEA